MGLSVDWSNENFLRSRGEAGTSAYRAALRRGGYLPEEPEAEPVEEGPPEPCPEPEIAAAIEPELSREQRIEQLLAELEALECQAEPFLARKIAGAVAKAHGLTFKEMISKRRHKHLSQARQHAMWAIKEHTTLSTPQIGRVLGGLDHSTILHGVRRHKQRMARNEAAI